MGFYLTEISTTNRCFGGSFSFDTTTTGATDWIMLNPDASRASVQLKVLSTASVVVEATVSPINSVLNDTADWLEWDNGSITGDKVSQASTKSPATAIRLNVKTALAGNNAFLSIRTER